eukprot:5772052-Prymnesium_polylepis.1
MQENMRNMPAFQHYDNALLGPRAPVRVSPPFGLGRQAGPKTMPRLARHTSSTWKRSTTTTRRTIRTLHPSAPRE